MAAFRRFEVDGDRDEHGEIYFALRRRLFDAAIGALLDERVPIGAVEELLWAACDEYAWALPAHIPELGAPDPGIRHDEVIDLYAAETAFALAEITVLLGERLHPLVVARVRREVERRVLTPFRGRRWDWERSTTNWSAVCAASVGLAALHLETSELDGILARCTAAMDAFLSGYGDDGICVEGLNYWTYGFGHFAIYAEALRQCTGDDLWAGRHRDRLAAMLGGARAVSLGGRAVAAFSDAEPYGTTAPALAALVEVRDPQAAVPRELWSEEGWSHNWGPVVRQFAWARDAADAVEPPAALAHWFADAQWLVSRTVAGGSEIGFAAKGGDNDEPHNHDDLGSFVLAVDGQPLLSELGMGYYDGAYFDPATRYDALTAGAQGHSVPQIGGVRQHAGADARAEVVRVAPEAGELEFELGAAYEVAGLRSVRRTFGFGGGTHAGAGVLAVTDVVEAAEPIEVVERFVSLFPIELDGAGAVIRGHRTLRLRWPPGWTATVAASAYRTHDGADATAWLLDLRGASAQRVVFRLDAAVVPAG